MDISMRDIFRRASTGEVEAMAALQQGRRRAAVCIACGEGFAEYSDPNNMGCKPCLDKLLAGLKQHNGNENAIKDFIFDWIVRGKGAAG